MRFDCHDEPELRTRYVVQAQELARDGYIVLEYDPRQYVAGSHPSKHPRLKLLT